VKWRLISLQNGGGSAKMSGEVAALPPFCKKTALLNKRY